MALFKRLKKDIGITDETKEKEKEQSSEKKVSKNKDKEAVIKNTNMSKNNPDWLKSKGQLAVDVYQTDECFCVQSPIAGVNQSNLDISVENNMLIIKGEREEPHQNKEKKYLYQECYWGPFSREIMLPDDLKPDRIKASLKNGILLITIPKTKETKKKVVVEVN